MIIGIPAEIMPDEKRVAISPEQVRSLIKSGFDVRIEHQAGFASGYTDSMYRDSGATIVDNTVSLFQDSDILLKVNPPMENPSTGRDELDLLKPGSLFIGFFYPLNSPELVKHAAKNRIDVIAMDMIPRISRAQRMDALSSQSNLAGYRAVIMGANASSKAFPLMMTAAGTVSPARVLVLGAGVAGLQAIATAKRLGALVEVSDVRPEVKEQVESLGARYIESPDQESLTTESGYAKEASSEYIEKQKEILAKHLSEADVVITTALVPGKKAPVLITRAMVDGMRPGTVIVDMAAGQGGNCELTEPGREVNHNGKLIIGETNIPSLSAGNASALYARNICSLIEYIYKDGTLNLNHEDEILSEALIVKDGNIINESVKRILQ